MKLVHSSWWNFAAVLQPFQNRSQA